MIWLLFPLCFGRKVKSKVEVKGLCRSGRENLWEEKNKTTGRGKEFTLFILEVRITREAMLSTSQQPHFPIKSSKEDDSIPELFLAGMKA